MFGPMQKHPFLWPKVAHVKNSTNEAVSPKDSLCHLSAMEILAGPICGPIADLGVVVFFCTNHELCEPSQGGRFHKGAGARQVPDPECRGADV